MSDVCKEASKIRLALEDMGWRYMGGGPYPHAPEMHFQTISGRRLDVKVSTPKKEPKT